MDLDKYRSSYTPGALRILDGAETLRKVKKHEQLGLYHLLTSAFERNGAMAEHLALAYSKADALEMLRGKLKEGHVGSPVDLEELTEKALENASLRDKEIASERDLIITLFEMSDGDFVPDPEIAYDFGPAVAANVTVAGEDEEDEDEGFPTGFGKPGAKEKKLNTDELDKYGRDLTAEARTGSFDAIVGRDDEVEMMVETLCRRTKRNPLLIGPPGVGKTAIVESFAKRVAEGNVPDVLKDVRVYMIQPSNLVAGSSLVGQVEEKMTALLEEARQEGILLFVDEVHTLIGAGQGGSGSTDLAQLFKPVMSRGEIAMIAATTDDEYRRYIKPDGALERRFQIISVQELDERATLQVLVRLRDVLGEQRGVEIPDEILVWIVEFAAKYVPNRYFPDKAIDFLEQAVAYAMTHAKQRLEGEDVVTVAKRMIGMPLDVEEGLQRLRQRIEEQAVLTGEDLERMIGRMAVTLRGLDFSSKRPNLVTLLTGEAFQTAPVLAELTAETLFGSRQRVIVLDMGHMTNPHDVSALIGTAPGYVGYSDALPLHTLARMPFSVVRIENVDSAHPTMIRLLSQALDNGYFTMGQGDRIHISEAIVLLTARSAGANKKQRIGFGAGEAEQAESPGMKQLQKLLGTEFMEQVDLIIDDVVDSKEAKIKWLEHTLLGQLAERYAKRGLMVTWDRKLLDWLADKQVKQDAWERLIDTDVTPHLIPYLDKTSAGDKLAVVVKHDGKKVVVKPVNEAQKEA